jgi:hypothetical protein
MKVQIIFHYPNTDQDCDGDYYYVEIKVDGQIIKSYGDYYHDHGQDKAHAFLEGLAYCKGKKLILEHINVPDCEDYG